MNQNERQRQFQGRIEENRKILYKVCRLYCSDPDDREDLGQEILVQLWRSFSRFDGRCQFSTWMYRVALNTAISFVRSETTRKRHVDTSEPRLLELAPAAETESGEARTMYRLIANLDPLPRSLILLYLDGNSYEEIADILGISATNVATKLNRIKNAMKQDAATGLQKEREGFTMDINELQLTWETIDRRLDTTVRLNRQFVIAGNLRRAKTPIRRLAVSLGLEATGTFCILLALVNFIFMHAGEPRFAWPAVLLDVWMIAFLAATIRQLFFIFTIDYDQPVVEIQKRIEELRLLRLRVIRWAFITGLIVWWLPFLVVVFKAFFGVDAYRTFGERFFYINGLASGAAVPISIWVSKKFSNRMDHSPFLQRIARHIEGNYIHSALDSIAAIAAFEREANG